MRSHVFASHTLTRLSRVMTATLCAASIALAGLAIAPSTAHADTLPDMQLGAFWNSASDLSDTLYVSTDGTNFQRIAVPYPTDGHGSMHVKGLPSYVNSLHDPGLFYVNGNFWMISGWVSHRNNHFVPMMGSSKDLVHWSYPNSGSRDNLAPTVRPAGTQKDGHFDTAGTDAMGDSDGSAWIVTALGFWGANHGKPEHDIMSPYIVHAVGLAPGADQQSNPGAQPRVSYGALKPIRLPEKSSNWIDPSLYKENGTYYLSIKKNGITNQIYAINDLNRADNPHAWRKVNMNVITGYEGPSLAKLHGTYYMYTDKLGDYPPNTRDRSTGVFVTMSNNLYHGWHGTHRITTRDELGRNIPNRHGSVLTITDLALKQMIWNLRASQAYGRFSDVNRGDWFSQAVDFVSTRGIMTGNPTTNNFEPNRVLTRQEAATLLWKHAGSPSVSVTPNYKDASRIAGYARTAVAWAQSTGVMGGYGASGKFGPADPLTREQTAKVLQIASGHKDETASDAKFNALRNHERTNPGLASYMIWATDRGVINGVNGDLQPQGQTTRGQMAKMMMNCINNHIFAN